MNNENLNINIHEEEEGGFDFKIIIMKLFIYWKWFIVSIVGCLLCAFVYLRYATPVYRVQATIMINDEKKGSFQNQMMAMQDFGFMTTTGGIDNEIEILRSKSMIKQAVLDLGIYTTYRLEGRFSSRTIYGKYPVDAYISRSDLDKMTKGITLQVSQPDSLAYTIEYEYMDPVTREETEYKKTVNTLPYTVKTPVGDIYLSKGEAEGLGENRTLYISIVPPIRMAKACLPLHRKRDPHVFPLDPQAPERGLAVRPHRR